MRRNDGAKAKRTKSSGLRKRAWWVLRKNKAMVMTEILSSICDGSEKQADGNLRHFFCKLVAVGILTKQRISDGKPTSNGVYLYSVVKDIGSKSPVIRKSGVYDPNSQSLLEFKHELD